MSVLSMKNVKYRYSKSETYAVKMASCEFDEGKVYTIIGPSGSGKSTILSMLAGLDTPTEGEVYFGNANLKDVDIDRYRREDISIVFQAFQLFPLLTVMENVCYPMQLSGTDKENMKKEAERLLHRVGINKEQFKRFPSNLSGGEQQRVAIARSLASGARVILADEPTGNLDGANTERVMEILTGLAHEDGYCVIIVTHDMEVANQADVTFKMKDGYVEKQ